MKDIEEFIKTFVTIDYKESAKAFGYYPFHMFVEKADGKIDIVCIADAYSVGDCYKIMYKYVRESARRIYMAIDFPATGDIDSDFVGLFITEPDSFEIIALPYSTITGEFFERINKKSNKGAETLLLIGLELHKTLFQKNGNS